MDLNEIASEIRYRLDRMKYYGETPASFTDWMPWLSDLETAVLNLEDSLHDDCYSAETMQDEVDYQTKELQKKIQTLEERIEELERAPRELENLTPEDRRAQFKLLN